MNVFEAIIKVGHDEDYSPTCLDFEPTHEPPGTANKIDVLRQRVENGQPLWHDDDKSDYVGVTGLSRMARIDQGNDREPGIKVIQVPKPVSKPLY